MNIELIEHIHRYVTLSEEEKSALLPCFRTITVARKELLHREGDICKSLYFVEKGCLRMFYIDEKGTEHTTQFALEGWWLADFMSVSMQKPSHFYIQSVEQSMLLVLDSSREEELFAAVPAMERYFRLIYQRAYAALQMRIKYLHDMSKEESYFDFSSKFPEFTQRIPQYMLASYLGFTPEYLSELRKKGGKTSS